jgi:ABC-2 type transport system ATP-binding protein
VNGENAVAAIRVAGARKVYRPAPWSKPHMAVEDVSIEVAAGAVHGLLGPNGAGKTTTLKMLLGLARPDAGTFEVLGSDARRPAGRAALGFLPEQPYFPTQLTGEQAMRLYAKLAGVSRADTAGRVKTLLERVGLERHGHTRLSAYSRGMLQRLGIAQALVGSPRVVILDEPASGLDPVGQRDVRNLMLELKGGVVAAEGRIDDLLNVAGRTAVRATGLGPTLPPTVATLTDDAEASGGVWSFSVPDASARTCVDAVDDAGGRVVSLVPKRESLEDYFTRLLSRPSASGR